MKINQIIDLIKQKHHVNGIDINPPATLLDITEFERQMGFLLPTDFKEFYLICNGFSCNEDIFDMIPLEDIRRHQENFGNNWFYFSEYMIYADMWGLRLIRQGKYEIFNGSFPDKSMTSSLTEFLQRFLLGNVFETGGLYEWQEELGIK